MCLTAVVGHAGGAWGGDPQTGFMSPSEFLCSSNAVPATRYPKPLSAAVSHSPISQIWVC